MYFTSDIMYSEGRIAVVTLFAAGQPLSVTLVPFLKPTSMLGYLAGQTL